MVWCLVQWGHAKIADCRWWAAFFGHVGGSQTNKTLGVNQSPEMKMFRSTILCHVRHGKFPNRFSWENHRTIYGGFSEAPRESMSLWLRWITNESKRRLQLNPLSLTFPIQTIQVAAKWAILHFRKKKKKKTVFIGYILFFRATMGWMEQPWPGRCSKGKWSFHQRIDLNLGDTHYNGAVYRNNDDNLRVPYFRQSQM